MGPGLDLYPERGDMIEKQPAGDTGRVLVTFRISHYIWADRFAVVGDFDGQHREVLPMVRSALDPDWHTTVALDSGRRYSFLYLCDDAEWNSDGSADDCIVDCDGRVYGVVDTSMGWPLPSVRSSDSGKADLSGPEYVRSSL